eukprot:bmy_03098T0
MEWMSQALLTVDAVHAGKLVEITVFGRPAVQRRKEEQEEQEEEKEEEEEKKKKQQQPERSSSFHWPEEIYKPDF